MNDSTMSEELRNWDGNLENFPGIIPRPRNNRIPLTVNLTPREPGRPTAAESTRKRVSDWITNVSNEQRSPACSPIKNPDNIEQLKKEYNESYNLATDTVESSLITSENVSPLELKLDELKEPLLLIEGENLLEKKEKERLDAIKEEWKKNGFPNPEEWPRLRFIPNYDEDVRVQKSANKLKKDIEAFRKKQSEMYGDEDEEDGSEEMSAEQKEAWAVIQECSSEDNRFEASELIEYKNHDWCVALRICREKQDKENHQLLVYSYQCGIQRFTITTEQMHSLGETLLMKYKTNPDHSVEVLPIYSALPSTGLMSLKYRTNKGIELRVYGIINFVDFERDEDQQSHKTMIWTDALGPIYLSYAERTNMRRKMGNTEMKLYGPLRLCQITVKGEFTSNVANGTHIKWTIGAFTPLVEEANKDPNIGRNLWPARVIRMDDLVVEPKISSRAPTHRAFPFQQTASRSQTGKTYHQSNHAPIGTWLRSVSEPELRIFAGNNLTGIIRSAGPEYAARGIMMAYVVPVFHQNKFIYYEALVAGPPRIVMIVTEGRFLNYSPKTFAPSIRKMQQDFEKKTKLKPQVNSPPAGMKQPEHRMKSLLGFEEFHFDF